MALRASTQRHGMLYRGVLRDGKSVVWTCPHLHKNRDMQPGISPAAQPCAYAELQRRAGK